FARAMFCDWQGLTTGTANASSRDAARRKPAPRERLIVCGGAHDIPSLVFHRRPAARQIIADRTFEWRMFPGEHPQVRPGRDGYRTKRLFDEIRHRIRN